MTHAPPRLGAAPLATTAHRIAPGSKMRATAEYMSGDFYVVHGSGTIDKLIQATTASHWNHVGAIVSPMGATIESTDTGLVRSNLAAITNEFFIVHLENVTVEQRVSGIAFVEDLLKRGDRYGFLTYPTILLKTLTRSRLVIEIDGTDICSELVARMLEHMGVILPMRPALVTPADLYNWFVANTV